MRPPLEQVESRAWTRRELLQLAQVLGLGGALAAFGVSAPSRAKAESRPGVCRLCTMHCGIVASVKEGRIVRVDGDLASATSGFLCAHGRALREVVHAESRLRTPLVRDGDAFRPAAWDDALAHVASRIRAVVERYGPEAVVVQTGWPFVRHPLTHLLRRFCHALGTPNLVTVASLCEASGRMGRGLVCGSRTRADLKGCRSLLLWGANPPSSFPPFAQLVLGLPARGRSLFVVDPVRTEAARIASMHLQPLPGTDGAVALGIAHVLIAEGLCDAAFVEQHVHGFPAFAERARAFDPARVEAESTVPREQLVTLARRLAAEGPVASWEGLGVEHHRGGVEAVRAISAISALLGHFGAPGGERLIDDDGAGIVGAPLPVLFRFQTPTPAPPPPKVAPLGSVEHPLFQTFNRQAQGMLLPEAILHGRPYPVKALVLFGANPFVTSPGGARWQACFDALELVVAIDPFLTASAARADVVLPAATFVEGAVLDEDDRFVARSPMIPEQHGARSDWDILRGLAHALQLGEWFPWATLGDALRAPEEPLPAAPGERTILRRALGRFPTSTGKLELVSEAMREAGLDPLIGYLPPAEALDPTFPLRLVTGPRTAHGLNSQFRQLPSIARRLSPPSVRVHPVTARDAGIADGARVTLTTRHGAGTWTCEHDDAIHPQAVVVPAGAPGLDAASLCSGDDGRDPVSGFPELRAVACRIEPGGEG